MSIWHDPAIVLACQLTLALTFGLAAWSKARALTEFSGVVRNYRLLPEAAVVPVAYAVPVLEAATALALLLGPARPVAGVLALGLLAVFTVAIVVNILRGRTHIDCGCFRTALKQRLSWWLVARNGVLIGMAALVAAAADLARPAGLLDAFTAAMAATTLVLFYAASGHVLSEPLKATE